MKLITFVQYHTSSFVLNKTVFKNNWNTHYLHLNKFRKFFDQTSSSIYIYTNWTQWVHNILMPEQIFWFSVNWAHVFASGNDPSDYNKLNKKSYISLYMHIDQTYRWALVARGECFVKRMSRLWVVSGIASPKTMKMQS